MKRLRAHGGGYTIVETLIYLGVTSALFVGVAIFVSGRQAQTEFQQTVREIESTIADINNDIVTGYFPSPNVSCSHTSSGPDVGSGSEGLGTRGDCLFLGRLLHVAPSGSNDHTMRIYTIVGTRLNSADTAPATTLDEAGVKIFPDEDQLVENRVFSSVVSFHSLTYSSGASSTAAFGLVSTLGPQQNNPSGTAVARTLAVNATQVGSTDGTQMAQEFSGNRVTTPGEITLCINSQASDQHAILTIGSATSSNGVRSEIQPGGCA